MFKHQIRGVRQPAELMRENMIVKHLAGSKAYGTNLPTSDTDYRGVFCADPINLLTPFFNVTEAVDADEEDTKLFELSHFMKLCLDCNPNVVETLWVDESDITFTTPAYKFLREHRAELLSAKIAFTTSGYALSQLKRIKGHNKWLNNSQREEPPRQIDFVSLVQNFSARKLFKINLEEYRTGYRLEPYGGDIFGLIVAPSKKYETFSDDFTLNTVYEEDSHSNNLPLAIVKFNKEEYKLAKEKHSQYWTWKKNRNEARSELEEQFGYDCYSDDTEFLTSTGWKKFDDVTDSDLLATFNQYSQKVEYQTPTERIDSLYTGNMYHFTGHHTDCLVTANHNMYIRPYSRSTKTGGKWDFCRAGELPETFDTLTSIAPKTNRQILPKNFPISILNKVSTLDFLRIIGWYVSDGTMTFYENENVKSMRISQSKPQSKLTQTLTKQRNRGKIDCKHYLYEKRGLANYPENIWVFDRELSQCIYNQCGHLSTKKRLPAWSYFLTKREMTTLLVALLQGDGSQRDHQNHTHVYYSKNYNLAGDVQRLALLCGFETSLYGPYDNGMYHVHINMKPTNRRTTRSRVTKIPVVNKRIVCFMVPNYTLVTRRNGQIGLHGNTKHAMHLVRLLRMGKEALEEGVLYVKRPDAQELLEIRNGAWTYEECVKYAEEMDSYIREDLYKNTCLPKKPNLFRAAEILMETQRLVWDE